MTVTIIYERVLPDGTPYETTDVDYCCGWWCASDALRKAFDTVPGYVDEMVTRQMAGSWHALDDDTGLSWGKTYGGETDYDMYCAGCGDLLWVGLETLRTEVELLAAYGMTADDDVSQILA